VLTNGRTFSNRKFVIGFDRFAGQAIWAVPLYADVSMVHDDVVQAEGAFEETIDGLYNIAERGHRIEIRCVVHRLTLPRLQALARFIHRNLPFVEHVALMGLEPMGFTRRNRGRLWVDPNEARPAVQAAAYYLADCGTAVSIYNTPLCLLDREAWPFARRSISDWKNVYAPECGHCDVRERCCGFFKSAGPEWRSSSISPVFEGSSV
jgi:His-Xaa-Ser system radical SAM maturase HxsC